MLSQKNNSVLILPALFFLISLAPCYADITTGLMGWWKLDEATGVNAVDSSGQGNTGTVANNPPSVAGMRGNALSFNGSSQYVEAAGFSWPAGGPITISFWQFVNAADVRQGGAFSIGDQDSPNRCLAHAPWTDNVLYWDYGDSAGGGRVGASYINYLNKWTHVVLVSAGNGGDFQGIYLDGVLVNSAGSSDGPNIALSGITIGQWGMAAVIYHKAKMDDFRVYNRVLTADDVKDLYTYRVKLGLGTFRNLKVAY